MFLKFDKNVCRICLQQNATISFFEADDAYINELKYCTDLEVSQEDGLPSSLCQKCSLRLRTATDFKRQALASDDYLKKFIANINSKFSHDLSINSEPQDDESQHTAEPLSTEIYVDDDKPQSEVEKVSPTPTGGTEIVEPVTEKQSDLNLEMKAEQESGQINNISTDTVEDSDVKSEFESQQNEETLEECFESVEILEGSDGCSVEYLEVIETPNARDDYSMEDTIEIEYIYASQDDEEESTNELFENVSVEESRALRRRNTDGLKAYNCKICDRAYVSKASLMRHNRTHTEPTPFQCQTCNRWFRNNQTLEHHVRLHTVARPFKCNICGHRFTRNLLLSNHMRSHTGEKPFKCDDCGEKFKNKDILRRHYYNEHKKVYQSLYKCRICHLECAGKTALSNHIKLHRSDEKPIYQCEHCDRKYLTKPALKFHFEKKHSGKSLYNREEIVENSKKFLEGVIPSYTDAVFRANFRMSCSDVEDLILDVCEKWYETNIVGRKRLPVEKALLVTLWTLVTKECIRTVSKRFQIHRSGVHVGFLRMCQVFYELAPKYIKWPSVYEAEIVAQKFSSVFPGIIGCIGSTHVRISRRANDDAYKNRRGEYSVTLQATCDAEMIFTDLNIGAPGGLSETEVWKQSNLYTELKNGQNMKPQNHIIGNCNYPLETFMMTPFRETFELSKEKRSYNMSIDIAHRPIRRAFEILKRNFQRVQHLSGRHDKDYRNILTTACIMHNISQKRYPESDCTVIDRIDDYTDHLTMDIEHVSSEALEKRESIVHHIRRYNV